MFDAHIAPISNAPSVSMSSDWSTTTTLRTNGMKNPSSPNVIAIRRLSLNALMSNDSPARNIRYRIPIAPRSSTSRAELSQPITNGPKIIPPAINPTMPGIRKRSARVGPSTTMAKSTAMVASTLPISTPVPL